MTYYWLMLMIVKQKALTCVDSPQGGQVLLRAVAAQTDMKS